MEKIDRLLAIEEIKALKARYFRMVDTKDIEGFGNVFAPDGVLDLRFSNQAQNTSSQAFDVDMPADEIYTGREAIVELTKRTIHSFISVHHGFTPEIEIDSDTEAHGIWVMEDRLWLPTGDHKMFLHGFGHYHERYRKIDNEWTIAYCKLTRSFLIAE